MGSVVEILRGLSGTCIINPVTCTIGGTFMVWIRIPPGSRKNKSIFSSVMYWDYKGNTHYIGSGFILAITDRKM